MATTARRHTKLGQRDFRKIYPNVWRRDKEDDALVGRSSNGCKCEDAGERDVVNFFSFSFQVSEKWVPDP